MYHSSIKTLCNMLNCIFSRKTLVMEFFVDRVFSKGFDIKWEWMYSGKRSAKNSTALTSAPGNQICDWVIRLYHFVWNFLLFLSFLTYSSARSVEKWKDLIKLRFANNTFKIYLVVLLSNNFIYSNNLILINYCLSKIRINNSNDRF